MNRKYALLVIVIAAIMAIAAFITISLWIRSPEAPVEGLPADTLPSGQEGEAPQGVPYEIDGVVVYLNVDPANALRLQQDPALPQGPTAATPASQPTLTPLPQAVATLPLPTNTPVPANPAQLGSVAGVEPFTFVQYVVQGEDTLYRITEKQKTSIELMAVHGIDAADLVAGATLTLPVANPNYCASSTPYVVRPGDTVFSIANRFNTTTQRLAQINNLGADFRIDIAKVLCIAP